MQSSLNTASNSHQFQNPWRIQETQFKTEKLTLKNPKICVRIRRVTGSLRTSIDYEPEERVGKEPGRAADSGRLPVVVQSSGRVSRYFWDGFSLQLVGVDGGASSFSFDSDDGFRNLCRICRLGIRDFFIPKRVGENYMEYVKWKFLHRVFSSALQVLATQVLYICVYIYAKWCFLLG